METIRETTPAGTYNLFVRAAGGNGARTESADISVVSGNAVIGGSGPYKFGVKGTGWQTYDFMPVTDNAGNLIQITLDGNPSTLQVLQNQASDNMNFFMLMPLATVQVSTAIITNVYPDGVTLYQATNKLSFTVSAPDGISANDISVSLTGTNLFGQGFVTTLTSGNGLTLTGTSVSWNVTASLNSNTIYSAFIQVNDASGVPASLSVSFDTINPAYTFETEDFDYASGQFIDNPQTNAYNGLDGVAEVDFHATQHGGAYNRVGLTTENASDKLRPPYNGTGLPDYDVGFNDGGNWGNYTRNYPAGTYNIFVRASNGNGNGSADSGNISVVTSGVGTTTQTLLQLGKFGVFPTGGWQTYAWVPVKDTAGNLAQFTGGSLKTLRMTITGGNCNENFFLLMPVDPNTLLQPYVDGFTPDGLALFQYTNKVSFVVHSQPGTTTGNITLNLNGVNVSGLTFSGTPNLRNVSCPIQANTYYTAIVSVTDANGTALTTNSFGTFNSTNYQWEAEDYDYDGGSYLDNPQVNLYNGLGSIADVDNHQSDFGANPFLYRLNTAQNPAPSTTTSGDQARAQLTGGTDYNIGFFGGSSWCNYTRHFPAGTYNVIGRFAEGANSTEAILSQVTSGVGTTNQTKTMLGTFHIPLSGWSSWEWVSLKDGNGNLAKVVLDGSASTLQLGGSTVNGQPEVNVNFLMLVPVTPTPQLTATVSSGNITISFPTQTGYSYQLQYKNALTDASWITLGSAFSGNGAIQSATYPTVGNSRFYRVGVQ